MTPSVDEASLAREVSGGYPVSMSTLPDTAAATVAAHAMLEPGAPVLAMVSGGADSVALPACSIHPELLAD